MDGSSAACVRKRCAKLTDRLEWIVSPTEINDGPPEDCGEIKVVAK